MYINKKKSTHLLVSSPKARMGKVKIDRLLCPSWLLEKIHLLSAIMGALLLAACENVAQHSAITVDTNAYYAVYQKTPEDTWRVILRDNVFFRFRTTTFTVDDSNTAFGIVFVCPSIRADRAHEVNVYYSTKAELNILNFKCRRSLDEILEKPVYGSIKGVDIAGAANPDGDFVRLALSNETSLNVWEAYAAMVRTGTRDLVALKGKQSIDGIEPKDFLIRRKLQLPTSTEPLPVDINFDGGAGFITKEFDPNSRSTVNITGANDDDTIQANISFLSQNKTVLKLAASSARSFSFLPIPLEEFTELDIGGFPSPVEFNPGEGHELSVVVKSDDGLVTRETSKFFTISDALTHEIRLPSVMDSLPLLAVKDINDLQGIILNWSAYQDPALGNAQMYRWVIEGLAAAPLPEPDKKVVVNTELVRWNIIVTLGWLNALGQKGRNFTLVIPTYFDKGTEPRKIDKDDNWRREWGFRASTPVSWQMSAISVSKQNNAGDVIEYFLNRTFDENLQFSQVYVRSSTRASSTNP